MLYDELIRIEKMIEGNEYFVGGVSYFVGIDRIDSSISLDLAVKNRLLELDAIRTFIEKGNERVLIDFYISD